MRYIDADKLVELYEGSRGDEWNKKTAPTSWAEAFDCAIADIDDQPTADVVSKSEVEELEKEVERLTNILNSYALQYGTVADKQKVIDKAKSEVAREIFEEIEETFKKRIAFYTDMANQSKFTEKHYAETMIKNCEIYLQEIAELKKEYTEGKQ